MAMFDTSPTSSTGRKRAAAVRRRGGTIVPTFGEVAESGRTRLPAKEVAATVARGFKSLPLRFASVRSRSVESRHAARRAKDREHGTETQLLAGADARRLLP